MSPSSPDAGVRRPVALALGAALVVVEGLVLLGLAVAEVASVQSERVGLAVSTGVFFALAGAGMLACGVALWRLRSWGRSPVVVAQLIFLLTAWSFRGIDPAWVAPAMAGFSVAALVGVFHPASIRALMVESGD